MRPDTRQNSFRVPSMQVQVPFSVMGSLLLLLAAAHALVAPSPLVQGAATRSLLRLRPPTLTGDDDLLEALRIAKQDLASTEQAERQARADEAARLPTVEEAIEQMPIEQKAVIVFGAVGLLLFFVLVVAL